MAAAMEIVARIAHAAPLQKLILHGPPEEPREKATARRDGQRAKALIRIGPVVDFFDSAGEVGGLALHGRLSNTHGRRVGKPSPLRQKAQNSS
jgi:hypothetical protein